MTIGQMFPDVWLPRHLEMDVTMTLAVGPVNLHYTLDYHDYRQPEVTSTIGIPAGAEVLASRARRRARRAPQSPEHLAAIQVQGNILTPEADIVRLAGLELGMAIDAHTLEQARERLRGRASSRASRS
jgi:hypothetical protein